MRIIFVIIVCAGFILPAFPQQSPEFSRNSYTKGVITFPNFSKNAVSDIRILKDSILYKSSLTGQYVKKSFNDIYYIKVLEGNNGLKGAMFGLIVTGVITLSEVITVSTSDDYIFKDNAGLIYLGLNSAGFCVGGLIGLAFPKWRTYYLSTPYSSNSHFDLYVGKYSTGIKYKYVF